MECIFSSRQEHLCAIIVRERAADGQLVSVLGLRETAALPAIATHASIAPMYLAMAAWWRAGTR